MHHQWASLSTDGRPGHLTVHIQLEMRTPGVLVSSYCFSTYRIADSSPPPAPPSCLGTFSSSSFGGTVINPIADCEHPLLYLLSPGRVSQETAISGSFQQNLFLNIFIRYFPHLHFQYYPKSTPYPPRNSPTHPLLLFGPGIPLYWGI